MSTYTYKIESDYGFIDTVFVDTNRTENEATGSEIISRFVNNGGYSIGNGWEYPEDTYFQNVLLEKAYAAVLAEDFVKADTMLALNYWNQTLLNVILDKVEKAKLAGNASKAEHCLSLASFGKSNFRCRALNFVIWKNHKQLFDYILQKINASNISENEFTAAFVIDLENGDGYFCEQIMKKAPERFYLKKVVKNKNTHYYVPIMRTEIEIIERKKRLAAKYEILAIQKFGGKKDMPQSIITRLPYDVTRYMVSSYF